MNDVERIQTQLRESARTLYDAVAVPPFTCFFNPDDPSPWANYAIPDAPIEDEVSEALAELTETFDAQGRTTRLEFLSDFSPGLDVTLEQHGFVDEGKTYLMVCDRAGYFSGPRVPNLVIAELTAQTPVTRIQEFLTVQRRAFGDPNSRPVDIEDAEKFQARANNLRLFSASYEGKTVSVGSLTPPCNGVTEVTGIATLSNFRLRGFGTALTRAITRAAFSQGVDIVFLTASDAAAGRIYARVGFQAAGAAHAYFLPTKPLA